MSVEQSIRHNEKSTTAASAFGSRSHRVVQFIGILGCHRLERHAHSASAEFGVFETPAMARILWIRKGSYLRRLWKCFLDEFQPRAEKVGGDPCDAGNVAARIHEAFDESRLDQIPRAGDDDWNRGGSVLGSNSHAGTADHDDINVLLD